MIFNKIEYIIVTLINHSIIFKINNKISISIIKSDKNNNITIFRHANPILKLRFQLPFQIILLY